MVKLSNVYIENKVIDNTKHQFLLLFHHKLVNRNYFNSYSEFLLSNKENKYSIFGYFDDSFKVENKFWLMYEWPEAQCYMFFNQDKNPLNAEPNSDVGSNVTTITCSNANIKFSGLTKYGNDITYLDGTNDPKDPGAWYYAIGQISDWSGKDQIPCFKGGTDPALTEVKLWVKINDLSQLSRFVSCYSCKQRLRINISFSTLVYTMFLS